MKPAKGLRIKEIVVGKGEPARSGMVAQFHCTCRLNRGDVLFASEVDAPYQIRLGARDSAVGIEHGIIGMQVGGVREVRVPPQLTHVERKIYPELSDNAVLQYQIELIGLRQSSPTIED